jgi:hypothetical protein
MRLVPTLFAITLLVSSSLPANAQSTSSCTTTIITVNATGGNVSPRGINALDMVVGTFQDSGFALHGFRWANGAGTLFDFPGAVQTQLSGINNLGTAVGTAFMNDGSSFAFLLDKDTGTSQFSFPGAFNTFASGINNSGIVVGASQTFGSNNFTGFKRVGNTFETIQPPGAVSTLPTAISDSGVIVGNYSDGTTRHGFVSFNGQFQNFDFPGAASTSVNGINDRGDIVGEYRQTADSQGQGFTFKDGKFTSFQFPNATFTEFLGVNAQGDLVGDAVTSNNNGFLSGPGFLLKCRFEPPTPLRAPARTKKKNRTRVRGQGDLS